MKDSLDMEHFQHQYATEEACAEALFRARWPEGFRCPRCQGSRAYTLRTRKRYECADCGYQASLTAGTLMENTRTPLTKWFMALYMVARLDGVSATALQLKLEVTYKTAWTMLMKIRYAMSHEDEAQLLNGAVRMNPAIYGYRMWSRWYEPGEYPVMVGASVDEEGRPERLKIKRLSEQDVLPRWRCVAHGVEEDFRSLHVDPCVTDVLASRDIYDRKRTWDLTWLVRQAESWVNKTFIAVSAKHWQQYVDEFCYRYSRDAGYRKMVNQSQGKRYNRLDMCWGFRIRAGDRRLSMASSGVFQSLLRLSVNERAMTYAEITRTRPSAERRNPYYAA